MIDKKIYKTHRSPYGFHFHDCTATEKIDNIIHLIEEKLKKENFKKIIPASIDYPKTFEVYNQSESFRFRDHLGEDLSLRNDATVSVIKGITNHLEYKKIIESDHRYFYILPIYKDIKKNYPASREIIQLGVEWIGLEEKKVFPKLIDLATNLLKNIYDKNPTLLMGDVSIYYRLSEIIHDADLKNIILYRDAPGLAQLMSRNNWENTESLANDLLFPREDWYNRIEKSYSQCKNKDQKDFLSHLLNTAQKWQNELNLLKSNNHETYFEPLLIRKADYYSGALFEFYLDGVQSSPLRGGSYDGLIQKYSHLNIPAAGFALDISSLIL